MILIIASQDRIESGDACLLCGFPSHLPIDQDEPIIDGSNNDRDHLADRFHGGSKTLQGRLVKVFPRLTWIGRYEIGG